MSAPLACTRCGAAYEPVGANHTHDGMCPRCLDAEDVRAADREIASIERWRAHRKAHDAAEALARGGW